MFLILALLLITPLIGNISTNSVYAESDLPSITIEDKTIHRGQTFEVAVSLDSNPGLTSMRLLLEYDKNVMSFVGFERGEALKTHTFTPTNPDTEEGYSVDFVFLWDGAKDSSTGNLLILRFESKITAPIGKYYIKFKYDKQNTTTGYGQKTDVLIDNGEIEFTTGEFKVQYLNYDGSILQETDYNSGDIPSYSGEIPTRPTDEKYSYTFIGWKGAVSTEPKTICYVAQYSTTPQEYQVLFYVDGEYFAGDLCSYDDFIDLSIAPSKKNHNFSGWFLDENYTQKVTLLKMPAKDIILYGYMKYNIREENIPKIELSLNEIVDGTAYVDVSITENSGLSGFVLTLAHDRTALEFVGYDRGSVYGECPFLTTNTENGLDVDTFKFYWDNGANNIYETGSILTLKFKLKKDVPAGLYDVLLTYNEETDAKYMEGDELWYSKLNIVGTKVPLGRISFWEEEIDGGLIITVESENDYSPDTVLVVKRLTYKYDISEDVIIAAAGEKMAIHDIYSVTLMQNGVEIQPNGKLTVRLQLTKEQKSDGGLKLFELEEENNLKSHNSEIVKGYLVFETEENTTWAIIGPRTTSVGGLAPRNASILIISLCLLNIVTVSLLLIIKVKLRKKK